MATDWEQIETRIGVDAIGNPDAYIHYLDGLIGALDTRAMQKEAKGDFEMAAEIRRARERLASAAPSMDRLVRTLIRGRVSED